MVVTIVSHKGGVGKTTLAYHLARYLSEKAPTALFDGDPNRSAKIEFLVFRGLSVEVRRVTAPAALNPIF